MDTHKQFCRTIYATAREMAFLLLYARMTYYLIVLTVAIYIIGLFIPYEELLMLKPIETLRGQWWGLVTANFIHFAPWHITANMLGLLVFGPPVERVFGAKRFLGFYLVSGIFTMLFGSIRGHSGAGGSGALAGVIGAFVIFTCVWRKESDAGRGLFVLALAGSILFLFSGTIMRIAFGKHVFDDVHIVGFVFGLAVALIIWRRNLVLLRGVCGGKC